MLEHSLLQRLWFRKLLLSLAIIVLAIIPGSSYASSEQVSEPRSRQETEEPGTIAFILSTTPQDGTDFLFTGDLGTFTLDDAVPDDGDTYSASHTVTAAPGEYFVTNEIPFGWQLTDFVCESDIQGGSAVTSGTGAEFGAGAVVMVDLDANETITCRFIGERLPQEQFTVVKYHDLNQDGARSPDEPGLPGWEFSVVDDVAGTVASGSTDTEGRIVFHIPFGQYSVCETPQAGWENTDPGDGTHCKRIDVPEGGLRETIYTTDFEDGVGPEWSMDNLAIAPASGEQFLGRLARNNAVTLQLSELPPHRAINVSLDFYAIGSWDGNYTAYGPDIWELAVGETTVLSTTFSNQDRFSQAYPEAYPDGNNAARTGAAATNSLGFAIVGGDATYRLGYDVPHSSADLTVDFRGFNLSGAGDESWGIDNVAVAVVYENIVSFGNYELPKGDLSVTKIVDWSGFVPDENQTFEICIEGPAADPVRQCQSVGHLGGTIEWPRLLAGDYTLSESLPGSQWNVVVSDETVTIPGGGSATTATITNTLQEDYELPSVIEAESPKVIVDGTWTTTPDDLASGGAYLTGTMQRDYLTLIFSGPRLDIVYVAGPDYGAFNIEIDGTIVRTVDTNTPDTTYGREATLDYLTDEAHIARIIPVGGTVAIDAFRAVIDASGLVPATPALTSPAEEATVETIVPTLAWTAVETATHYELHVQTADTSVLRSWYPVEALICEADTCSLELDNELTNLESYTWQVRAANSAGVSPWSDSRNFTVDMPAPGELLPQAPSGEISTTFNPTYQWTKDNVASSYELVVYDYQESLVLQEVYTSTVCGEATCSVTPTTALEIGVYSWQVRGINVIGEGPWSTPQSFGIITSTVIMRGPIGGMITSTPQFVWTEALGAEWYQLLVLDPEEATIHSQWYEGALHCTAYTCRVSLDSTLAAGDNYSWYIRTWSSGYGMGEWNGPQLFDILTILRTAPANGVTLDNIDGTVSYEWQKLEGAVYYHLYVTGPDDYVYDSWHAASAICGETTCAVTPPAVPDNGEYRWWLQVWSSKGYSPWSVSPFTFRMAAPQVAGPIQNGPEGSITTGSPSFSWQPSEGATWYRLWIQGPDGIVHDQWYSTGDVCEGNTCEITPELLLPPAEYNWYVGTYGVAGTGIWSSHHGNGMIFTVDISVPTPPSPIGEVINLDTATFEWQPISNAVRYRFYLSGAEGVVLDQTYTIDAPESPVSCTESTCSLATDLALASGTYNWWVQSWNPAGGVWSEPRPFTYAAPMLIAPTGLLVDTSGAFDEYRLQWTDLGTATWYQVWLGQTTPTSKVIIQDWHTTDSVCSEGVCELQPGIDLTNGTYDFWVRGYNPDGNGPWNADADTVTFAINAELPAQPTLFEPYGPVTTSYPNLIWGTTSGLRWQQIEVKRGTEVVYSEWEDLDCETICNFTLPTELKNGAHSWRVRSWSPAGSGPWSPYQTFTVAVPVPDIPVLISPENSASHINKDVSFEWNPAEHATWYKLEVRKLSDDTVISSEWYAAAEVCEVKCNKTLTLPGGDYVWQVHGWSQGGAGDWSRIRTVYVLR
ncbi:MAG: hypothetical protein GYB66_12585 [Chloroflexi bacterium]|nr:hypothetical protein [Chloroflexota bacterium]